MRIDSKSAMSVVALVLVAATTGYLAGEWRGETKVRAATEHADNSMYVEGPWGMLRYWNSMLEMPQDLIDLNLKPVESTQWFFGIQTPTEVSDALRSCGLDDPMIARIGAKVRTWEAGGFVLEPDDSTVLAIPGEARAKLYDLLAKWPVNQWLGGSARFEKVGLHDWLEDSEMSPASAEMVRSLIYRKGNVQFFADFDLIIRRIADKAERMNFLRTLSRQNCIMGRLVIRPDDNLDSLANYWGRGGRERDVKILMEATSRADGPHEVPLRSLLPDFARDRMNRYRHEGDPATANCHYTAMNFFADTPNESLTDLTKCAAYLDHDYVSVTDGSRQFGDVVMIMANEREVLHTCNVIAGNIVFTKNGNSRGQPWLMADLKELVDYFGSDRPVSIRVIRRAEYSSR